jgi:hypothetical protein
MVKFSQVNFVDDKQKSYEEELRVEGSNVFWLFYQNILAV